MASERTATQRLGRRLQGLSAVVVMLLVAACATKQEDSAGPRADTAVKSAAPIRVVLVAGATGRTGTLAVERLLAEGYSVRALVRDSEQASVLPAGAVAVVGDATNPESLPAALKDVDAIISAMGARSASGPNSPEFIDYQRRRPTCNASCWFRPAP
jgi:NADPH:quinone reductase-like Zn-dependent oxidoreductase